MGDRISAGFRAILAPASCQACFADRPLDIDILQARLAQFGQTSFGRRLTPADRFAVIAV
jgi:hypothetical protein